MKAHDNNFDLIRLLAAFQVALVHGIGHFHVPIPHTLGSLLGIFPGVPSFFCISGFLIAKSVERNRHHLRTYALSRVLRIYPALILCSTIWLCLMVAFGVFHGVAFWKIGAWYLGAVTVGGFGINPQFFRDFGMGVWNGALWTVGVEMSFYVLLPLLYLMDRWGPKLLNLAFASLCFASFSLFVYFDGLHWGDTRHFGSITKAIWFSLPGNLWMLLFGTLIHRYFDRLGTLVRGKVIWWLAAYIALAFVTEYLRSHIVAPGFAIASFFIGRGVLAFLTVSAAYSFCGLSHFLLRGNDISYGLYIYHLPAYNLFIQFGAPGVNWFPFALATAVLCGCASWMWLERRMLGLKWRFAAPARPRPSAAHGPESVRLSNASAKAEPVT